MKTNHKNMLGRGLFVLIQYYILKCILLAVMSLCVLQTRADDSHDFKFNRLSAEDGLPGNFIQKIYQCRDGYIWVASRNGLYQYDGHTFKTYKSNLYNQELLSNNNIFCIEEDFSHHLWIGSEGLNMLDKMTGKISIINRREFTNNNIDEILATKDNNLFIGTDRGLFQYIYEKDSCITYDTNSTNGVLPATPIKSLIEDSRGHIWIGTWDKGLYRFEPETGTFYSYPQMNPQSSVHVIFEDSKNQIWIGTWGYGLCLLENAYDPVNVSWRTYKKQKNNPNSISYDVIYDISEDLNNNTLWIGTRDGLSILTDAENGKFENYYPAENDNTISANEVNSIFRDNQGMMWLGLLGGGINTVITRNPYFKTYNFEGIKQELGTNSVSSLFVDDEGVIWLGFRNYGLVQYDRDLRKHKLYKDIDGFSSFEKMQSVMSITEIQYKKQIWLGVYDAGIITYDKRNEGSKIKEYKNDTPWLPGGRVFVVYEDLSSNLWLGTEHGLSMLAPDNRYIRFDSLTSEGKTLKTSIITDITGGGLNEIWVTSSNNGIFRICGEGLEAKNYVAHNYSIDNKKLNTVNALCIFKDSKNRIWAGSDGGGLSLYDKTNNMFIPVHKNWNLPGDEISGIIEDKSGNLWIGTNSGLIKLTVADDISDISFRLFTMSDGLCDNSFNRKAIFMSKDGEIFFGGNRGLNSFYPEQLIDRSSFLPPVVITDIKTYSRSWSALDEKERYEISSLAPEYTDKINIDYTNNNFSIEFVALAFENPGQHTYAYMLEGFDDEWRYTNSSQRFAHYNNLKPGTYAFSLKATNANGVWNDAVKSMQIIVFPPPWKTWWAYLIYIFLISSLVFFVFRMLINRVKLQNTLQLREMEKAKAEEVNHTKLQFFTNITHELLTPLSIISASVDELKKETPQYSSQYKVMTNNINRLVRLLQQILEFRKAESGNLRLKVSQGDLAGFIANSIESFRPLIKKKHINLLFKCDKPSFNAYFDSDKIDKILYNLLSNASKYNKTGGNVCVELKEEDNDFAVIIVSDDGQGIPPEAQKNLFKRFYEGDYRRFNTIGTGIGLSLTKDLVTLHGGTIQAESEVGKGAMFTIKIPVKRNAYDEEDIDDTFIIPDSGRFHLEDDVNRDGFAKIKQAEYGSVAENIAKDDFPEDDFSEDNSLKVEDGDRGHHRRYNLLVVEDNVELLSLMVKLLGVEYNMFTAMDGKSGLDIIRSEDIDVVVSDIMMPEMDGLEFCKEIKNNIETSHIPVLVLTSKTSESDRVIAYESGADAFLNKPFILSVLHARINNLLKARERANRDFKKQLVFEKNELNYTTLDEEFLKKAIDCVHLHLNDPDYDQAQFAEDMNTSRSTLFRKMKSLTGMSYVSFIRNIRLKAACRIIEEKKQIRVSELAYAVGFNDPRYFSTCFRKEFGMQPREYYEKYVGMKDNTDNT